MEKKIFVFQIIASELVALKISLLSRECVSLTVDVLTTALGFCLSLKKTFSNETTFTVINKYCKGSAIQSATVFRPICLDVCLRVL